MIAKVLTLSIAYLSAAIVSCKPLDSRQIFANRFQNDHQNRLKDVVYFPESETENTNTLIPRNQPTLQNNERVTTSQPIIDCFTLSEKECAEYQEFLNDLFTKTSTNKSKQDNIKENLIGEQYDKIVQRLHLKNVKDNDYVIPCDEESTLDDYDSTTPVDDISFRLPPPLVAALLG